MNRGVLLSLVLAFAGAGCLDIDPDRPGDSAGDEPVQEAPPMAERPTPTSAHSHVDELAPLALDACDDPTYTDTPWVESRSTHLVLRYPADSAPAKDATRIASARERAYGAIRAALGVDDAPTITIYLSPNRLAAEAHHLQMGVAFEEAARIEVIYTGAPGGFESVRYGHELTHVLAIRLLPTGYRGLRILDEGLAEMLDQSRRDRHDSYMRRLRAFGPELAADPTELNSDDVSGRNHARAGSLAQYIADRFGWDALVDLFVATAVTWDRGCYRHPAVGCVDSPTRLAQVLDDGLRTVVGARWESVRTGWAAALSEARRGLGETLLSNADTSDVRALLAHMDRGMNLGDVAEYRSTLEGFYCDWGGEPERARIADTATASGAGTHTELVELYDIDMSNFPEAFAVTRRIYADGMAEEQGLWLEQLPDVGWRVTWGPDWQ